MKQPLLTVFALIMQILNILKSKQVRRFSKYKKCTDGIYVLFKHSNVALMYIRQHRQILICCLIAIYIPAINSKAPDSATKTYRRTLKTGFMLEQTEVHIYCSPHLFFSSGPRHGTYRFLSNSLISIYFWIYLIMITIQCLTTCQQFR